MIVGKGVFDGRGGHLMRGSFSIEQSASGLLFMTSDNFYFDGSPAPGFAFSASGDPTQEEATSTDFLRLPGTGALSGEQLEVIGRQSGPVPGSIDVSAQKLVFLWCYRVPFLLGIGEIEII